MKNGSKLKWLNREPYIDNYIINPGLRIKSRLYTEPSPYKHMKFAYPTIQYKVLKNMPKCHVQNLVHLCNIKNVFSKQLPEMGELYISRLVFDLEASAVILLQNGSEIAAISARFFEEADFVEISFLAVDESAQCGGLGRFVMNCFKKLLQVYEIYDILTCADNDALHYFKKQGFNEKKIMVHPSRWVGCIKDYSLVTLVHCKLYPDVDYMNFPRDLQKQITLFTEKTGYKIQKPSFSFEIKKPLYQHQPCILSRSIPEIVKSSKMKLDTPGMKAILKDYNSRIEALRNKFIKILDALENEDMFKLFIRPVTEAIAPKYFEEIESPMDFVTVRKKLDRYKDYYKSPESFAYDIMLISHNCEKYNKEDREYVRVARDLAKKFKLMYFEEFPNREFSFKLG